MISRVVDALVAAAATIAAVLGLTTLTENASWLSRAVWACLAVAAAGLLLRWLTSVKVLVLLGQVVLTAWTLVAMFAADRLWYGLPGPEAWQRVAELVNECVAVMQRYAAPIPATEGVMFVLVAAIAGLAVLVDYLAVTEEMPGVAGLPLLAAFLTAAANGGSSLSPWFFVVGAGMWLVLVARQGRGRVQRWSTTVASLRTPVADTDVESQVMWGFGNVARQLGVVAVLAAVVLPAVIPHLPTRYVLDGLGRSDGSIGRGGRVGFNSTVDLTRSLESGDDNIVLTYRTSAPSAPPLRVVVAANYFGGKWTPGPVAAPTQRLNQSRVISSQVPVADRQLQVESNYLSAPNVASVSPVVATDFGGTAWYADPATGDLYAQARPDSYSLTYREVNVTPELLQAGIPGAPSGRDSPDVQSATTVDAAIAPQVSALTDTVTAGTTSAYAAATAIQKWLRTDGGFNYSLQLPESVLDENGSQIREPILRFLRSKTGSCGQFAATMVMMARAKGIPARMATRLPARHAGGGPLHRAVVRRARLARAVVPRRRMAAVRTHPRGPHRGGPDLHDPRHRAGPRSDHVGHDGPRRHGFGHRVPRVTRARPRSTEQSPPRRARSETRSRPGCASRCTSCSSPSSWACSAAWSCRSPRSSSTVGAVREPPRPASWPRRSGTSWSRVSATSGCRSRAVAAPCGSGASTTCARPSSTPRPTRRWAPSSPRSSGRATRGRARHRSC